jgi:hypothetical protein
MGNTPQSNESARDKAVSLASGASDSRVAVPVIDRDRREPIVASIEVHRPYQIRLTRRRRAVPVSQRVPMLGPKSSVVFSNWVARNS